LGIKYKDGVMIAADTLGKNSFHFTEKLASYGSLARFADIQRVVPVGKFSILGASGDFSDFQYILKLLDELTYSCSLFLSN
jgi:20S proteasome subunit beta 7